MPWLVVTLVVVGLVWWERRASAAPATPHGLPPAPAPAPPAPSPVIPTSGPNSPLCQLSDLDPTTQGLVMALLSRPDVTATLLDQWGNYFDTVCPVVGALLHERAASWGIESVERMAGMSPPPGGWTFTTTG